MHHAPAAFIFYSLFTAFSSIYDHASAHHCRRAETAASEKAVADFEHRGSGRDNGVWYGDLPYGDRIRRLYLPECPGLQLEAVSLDAVAGSVGGGPLLSGKAAGAGSSGGGLLPSVGTL